MRSSTQLGTLAANTLTSGSGVLAADNEYRLISHKATWSLSDFTAGEGPITVGIAHGDYTSAEIEEWFESQSSMTRADQIQQEQSSRKCRQVGTFPGILGNETLNDGKPIRTKCNWAIPEGTIVLVWVYNSGNASLTTSAEVQANGQIFGRWT